jgi:hypothetical protein
MVLGYFRIGGERTGWFVDAFKKLLCFGIYLRMVFFQRKGIAPLFGRNISAVIAFWQPMTSMVTIQPAISSTPSRTGIAVISFDFSSVCTCPSTRPSSSA